jgi:hypothetical protein
MRAPAPSEEEMRSIVPNLAARPEISQSMSCPMGHRRIKATAIIRDLGSDRSTHETKRQQAVACLRVPNGIASSGLPTFDDFNLQRLIRLHESRRSFQHSSF